MHFVESSDRTRLAFTDEGPADATAILFAHSVGCDHSLWDGQAERFGKAYRVIRPDARGHGRSDAPSGPYGVEQLAGDVLAVADTLGIERFHLCGLSLGGSVGQWLALNAPGRLRSLVLCDTAARLGTVEGWQQRIDAALQNGMALQADTAMTRFFSDAFRARDPETVERFRNTYIATPAEGFAGCCAVLRDCDFREGLGGISVPTTVITGHFDVPTPPADAEYLAARIPGARLELLATGHLSAVEAPDAFNAAIERHLLALD
jgi:3-oxoadipate enol-lactonase